MLLVGRGVLVGWSMNINTRESNKIWADIVDLRCFAKGNFTGPIYDYPWLLKLITTNGFIIEIHTDVGKKTVKDICLEIADKLEADLLGDMVC